MPYKVVKYVRVEEDSQTYDVYSEAMEEKFRLENLQPENIFEVSVLNT
jgi:hypothetical protein